MNSEKGKGKSEEGGMKEVGEKYSTEDWREGGQ